MPRPLNSPIHITDLQDFWTALKERQYWVVLQKGIRILDTMINPHTHTVTVAGRGTATAPRGSGMTYQVHEAEAEQFRTALEGIEGELENLKGGDTREKLSGTATAGEPTQFDMGMVILIVEMIVQLFGRFRGRTGAQNQAAQDEQETGEEGKPQDPNRVVQPGVNPRMQPGTSPPPAPSRVSGQANLKTGGQGEGGSSKK